MVFRHHVFIGMATGTLALVQYKTRLYLLQVTSRSAFLNPTRLV